MKNKDISTLLAPVADAFRRYSLTIFIVVLVGGLSTAVLILNSTLQESSNISNDPASLDITTFDQATISRVNQLHTSSDGVGQFTLPSGRVNPFSE
jgi:hypothetical protein